MGEAMEIRPFTVCDYDSLMQWYRARAMSPIAFEDLPPTGFIVPDVAAGFLGKTDFQVGFVEAFVTNPRATPEQRNQALDLIAFTVQQEADRSGLRKLYALTMQGCIAERAEAHEFRSVGHFELLAKEI